jgi:hypothetical protein
MHITNDTYRTNKSYAPTDAVLKLLPYDVPGAKLKHEIVDKNSVDSLRRWLATRGQISTGAKREIVAS